MRLNLAFSLLLAMGLTGFGAQALSIQAKKTNELNNFNDIGEDLSQVALFGSDDGEISKLPEGKQIFADFCLQTRDDVQVFLKRGLNGAAMKVFNVMFNSADELHIDLSTAKKETLAESAEILKNSGINEAAQEVAKSNEEVQQRIEENLKKVRKASVFSIITEAARIVIDAVIETVSSETAKRLAILKAQFNGEDIRDQIQSACNSISIQLKSQLADKLRQVQRQLKRSTAQQKMKDEVAATRIENVGCVTTSRVVMVSRFCDALTAIGPIMYPMFGL